MLAALAALAVFIFTDAAVAFARSPSFVPLLAAACGAYALVTVVRGLSTGRVEPLSKSFHNTYERASQPTRFWASMGWNTFLGGLLIWLAFQVFEDEPLQRLNSQCFDAYNTYAPMIELAACNHLIMKHKNNRDLARALAGRGSAYYRLGDYERAQADYTRAIRLDPQNSSSHHDLAHTAEQLGNIERATVEYGESIRVDPTNADSFLRRGVIFLNAGKLDRAVADLTRAHQLQPDNLWPLANRGITYALMKDNARAKQDFIAVRALDPSNYVMLRGEAVLSAEAGDDLAAVDLLTASLKRDPENDFAIGLRAQVYRRLGKFEKAKADEDELSRLTKRWTDTGR